MTQSIERLYANSRSQKYDVPGPGFRYHLANLHAAIGLSQLRQLPEFIANRRTYARRYNESFSDLTDVLPPSTNFDDASIFHYVVRAVGGRRDELMNFLRTRGIETGIHWLPGHWFTWLKDERGATNLPVTDRVGAEIVTLPLWSHMSDDVLDRVIDAVRAFGRAASIASVRRRLAGRELLDHIRKAPADATPYRIPILTCADYYLRCVRTTSPREDDVERLTEWRNRHVKSFLTEFHATRERTRDWLVNEVANDDGRALFMIEHTDGRIAGYIGLARIDWDRRTAEADSVVRGEPDRPGLMTAGLRTLFDWARRELGILRFSVRVLADNPAVAFYERFGFSVRRSIPLRPVRNDDCLAWEELPEAAQVGSGDRVLLYMEES
jgi:RimJ/RimL family protein N-acetyltransferase